MRAALKDFALANRLYAGATVTFYTVSAGAKTTTKATLYAASTGSTTLGNPQVLGSDGKLKQAVYIEVPTIATITGLTVPSHDTGIINPAPNFRINSSTRALEYSFDGGTSWETTTDYFFRYRGAWLTATAYVLNDTVAQGGNVYLCVTAHTSGTFATDLAAAKWVIVVSGVLLAANNLSDVTAGTARTNLGLGTMALEAKTITTKGDVLVGGAAGALSRRAVGTDGQVLTADAAETDGVKWATPVAAASQSDMEAASSTTAYASPGRVRFHPGVAKAWLRQTTSAGAPSIVADYGISTITDNGAGDFTANFDVAFSSSTSYMMVANSQLAVPNANTPRAAYPHTYSTGSCRYLTDNSTGSAEDNHGHTSIVWYGDQ